MAIRERLREKAAELKENVQRDAEDAERRASIVQRARAVLQTSDDPRARRRAKAILARADPGTGAGEIDRRKKSRTQKMFERAEQSATVAAPIDATPDPTPDSRAMWAFASASPQAKAARRDSRDEPQGERGQQAADGGLNAAAPLAGLNNLGRIDPTGLVASPGPDPDWEDNPDHLDTPEEVREDLRESGLDPMDTDTKEEAMFGHFLVHSYADDDDLGGRTPAQLEAEHDMTVDAMLDFGVNHHSPMGRPGGAFSFADDWGLSLSGGNDR